eukprot:TRINITY_DN31792_c0_g1_i1.p1 TRINITY_DN31792_c0_g1~~TRINITY_DN31792_c0_g1_i1.p1  ORF type:complete len:330 (-),score=51.85 TRINITY_DN31792_c0_g1_i1:172-1161(-)
MKKTLSVLSIATISALSVSAQSKKNTKTSETAKPQSKVAPAAKDEGFSKTPNGLEYKIITDAPGTQFPKVGDYISAHLQLIVDDSVHFSTRQVMNNAPAEVQMASTPTKGDIMEGFTFMTPGDSAIFRYSVDSLLTIPGVTPAPWMKKGEGQMIYYRVVLAGVKSAADKQKEATEAAAKQKDIDDKLLQDYFKANNIKASKTASGLYYTVSKAGTGIVAQPGDKVSVNYTGKTMEGKAFDSNVDPQFQHVQPFEFTVGQGMVIKGWDEGFTIFKKGSKGTLYIPSPLAYGANSPDPSRIPVNGILIFDVELLDVIQSDLHKQSTPTKGK